MTNNLRNYENVLMYAQYLSKGLMKELIARIAEKEGKSLDEVMKEIDVDVENIDENAKRKILDKAFEVLDSDEVILEIFYDIKAIYSRIIRDILEIAKDEIKEEILRNYNNIGIEKFISANYQQF